MIFSKPRDVRYRAFLQNNIGYCVALCPSLMVYVVRNTCLEAKFGLKVFVEDELRQDKPFKATLTARALSWYCYWREWLKDLGRARADQKTFFVEI